MADMTAEERFKYYAELEKTDRFQELSLQGKDALVFYIMQLEAAAARAREQEREAIERELLGLLKGEFSSLSIGFNDDAACNYMTATEAIDNGMLERADWVNDEEEQRAKETNSIWTIQWYPDTPVGFCCYAASSLGALLTAIRARTEGGGE